MFSRWSYKCVSERFGLCVLSAWSCHCMSYSCCWLFGHGKSLICSSCKRRHAVLCSRTKVFSRSRSLRSRLFRWLCCVFPGLLTNINHKSLMPTLMESDVVVVSRELFRRWSLFFSHSHITEIQTIRRDLQHFHTYVAIYICCPLHFALFLQHYIAYLVWLVCSVEVSQQQAVHPIRGKSPHWKTRRIPCLCQAPWAVPGVILIWGILELLLQEVSVFQPFTVIMRLGMSLTMTSCRNWENALDMLAVPTLHSEWPQKNCLRQVDFPALPYLILPLHLAVSALAFTCHIFFMTFHFGSYVPRKVSQRLPQLNCTVLFSLFPAVVSGTGAVTFASLGRGSVVRVLRRDDSREYTENGTCWKRLIYIPGYPAFFMNFVMWCAIQTDNTSDIKCTF